MSGSYGKSKSENLSTSGPSSVWSGQSPYLQDLNKRASGLIDAPASDLTGEGRQQTIDYARTGISPIVQSTQQAFNTAIDPSQQNPYLQQAIQSASRPLIQQFQEGTLSGIGDQAVSSGQVGGSRQGIAEGVAQRGLQDTLGDISTNMAYQDYTGGMDRMMSAMDKAPAIANLGMMPGQTLQQIGAQQEQDPWLNLQRAQGIIGGPTVLSGPSRSEGYSKAMNISGGIGG